MNLKLRSIILALLILIIEICVYFVFVCLNAIRYVPEDDKLPLALLGLGFALLPIMIIFSKKFAELFIELDKAAAEVAT